MKKRKNPTKNDYFHIFQKNRKEIINFAQIFQKKGRSIKEKNNSEHITK